MLVPALSLTADCLIQEFWSLRIQIFTHQNTNHIYTGGLEHNDARRLLSSDELEDRESFSPSMLRNNNDGLH